MEEKGGNDMLNYKKTVQAVVGNALEELGTEY